MTSITELEQISSSRSFGGLQNVYSHRSDACNGDMRLSIFRPPREVDGEMVPVVVWLSGLTCTEDNFTVKAGAQRVASELGLLVVAPDTSPRGQDLPGEDDSYDLGTGAGFYLDATQAPWSRAYRMYSYVTREIPEIVKARFHGDCDRMGIMGHSMGGHGALTIHFKNPSLFKTCSAFAPIVAPTQVPWGHKAFSAYLGDDDAAWQEHDACALVRERPSPASLLVDQGDADPFLAEQLRPQLFQEACTASGQKLEIRMQSGYDHSYFFIASFIEDHLRHHHSALTA